MAPALSALHDLELALTQEINRSSENPLVTANGVHHHGQFHLATVASALDRARTALIPVIALVCSRLSLLLQPVMTDLPPFLSDSTPGSSGLMICEYVAQDALAQARTLATTTTGASLSISLNLEEHASFATQGSRQFGAMESPFHLVIALEALAATRALLMDPQRISDCPAQRVFHRLAQAVCQDFQDQSLDQEISKVSATILQMSALN